MAIYFFVYFIFFIFALYNVFISDRRDSVTVIQLVVLGTLMIFFAGLRWETGTDWANYRYYFRIIEMRPFFDSGMEVGYEMIVRAFKAFISSDMTPFLFFCAFFIVSITYYVVNRYSPYPIFSLFLLLSYSLVSSGFGVRQDLSITLTLLSTVFIQQRQIWRFLAIVGVATLMHNSALIFVPAYWIYKFKWTTAKALIVIAVVLACVALSEKIMSLFGPLVEARKTMMYLEMGQEMVQNPYITMLKAIAGRSLFLVLSAIFVKYAFSSEESTRNEEGHIFYNGLFNIYVFGIIVYVVFSPISLIFARLARPYDIYQIILIPIAYHYARRSFKAVMFAVVLAFSVLKFYTSISGNKEIYVPYKTILDTPVI
jgi:hypothetical protein